MGDLFKGFCVSHPAITPEGFEAPDPFLADERSGGGGR
jgi:hypothetical protein